jgi:hypothetical protein
MASTTVRIVITSDITADVMNLDTTATLTKTTTTTSIDDTTGLSRKKITATSKGASGEVTLYTADDFAAIPYLYIKNTDTTAGNRIYIYDDTTSGDPLQFQLDAGDWGFIPMHGDKTYKAYATTNPTTIEFMVMGQDQ